MNKYLKFSILICVFAVVAYSAWSVFLLQEDTKKELIEYKEPSLTQDNKVFFENKLNSAKQALQNIRPDASVDEKANLYLEVANYYHVLGFLKLANDNYKKSIEFRSTDPSLWYLYSQNLMMMTDAEEALIAAKKALSYDNRNPEYWKWQIEIEKDMGSDQSRINGLYVDAVVNSANHIDMITAYAIYLESIGNLQGAKDYWKNAIEINPAGELRYNEEIKRIEKLIL